MMSVGEVFRYVTEGSPLHNLITDSLSASATCRPGKYSRRMKMTITCKTREKESIQVLSSCEMLIKKLIIVSLPSSYGSKVNCRKAPCAITK